MPIVALAARDLDRFLLDPGRLVPPAGGCRWRSASEPAAKDRRSRAIGSMTPPSLPSPRKRVWAAESSNNLQAVSNALDSITGGFRGERSGPTKHSGFSLRRMARGRGACDQGRRLDVSRRGARRSIERQRFAREPASLREHHAIVARDRQLETSSDPLSPFDQIVRRAHRTDFARGLLE